MTNCTCFWCSRAEITDQKKSCKIHFCTKRCESCRLSMNNCKSFLSHADTQKQREAAKRAKKNALQNKEPVSDN